MSIHAPFYRPPPHKLPRLLLLDAEPRMAAQISLALSTHCLPFAFDEIYRQAVRGLLNETNELASLPDDDEFVTIGSRTYLRRNLEVNIRSDLEIRFGGPAMTAMLMAQRLHNEMPYFACCTIEDAVPPNWDAAVCLCDYLFSIAAVEPKEVYWLIVTDHPAGAVSKLPTWTINSGIGFGAIAPSLLTSNAEILSAMETLL